MKVKIATFSAILLLTVLIIQNVHWIQQVFAHLGLIFLCVTFAWQIGNLLTRHVLKHYLPSVNPRNKAVFITGCDTGFGHLTAKALNEFGFKVFAACLQPEGDWAKKLKQNAAKPEQMIIFGLDVTKDDEIEAAYKFVEEHLEDNECLWGIVNNAGIGVGGQIEWGSFETHFKSVFDVNLISVIKITRKFLPLIRQSRGRVVNLGSVTCRVAHPDIAAYSVTKHGVTAFTDGLRREMKKFGVHVALIEPAYYQTFIADGFGTKIKQIWETTSEEVKMAYTEQFLERVVNIWRQLPIIMSKRPQDVSDAILDAMVCSIKDARYNCSRWYERPLWQLLAIVPVEVQDLLFYAFDALTGVL